MEWISIKNNSPNIGEYVIVSYSKGTDSFVTVDYLDMVITDWHEDWIYKFKNNDNITHWMPIPPPPNK